jgi:hypothetical protein
MRLQLSSRAPALVWIGWLVENQAASPIKTAFEFGGDGRHRRISRAGQRFILPGAVGQCTEWLEQIDGYE